MKKHSRRRLRRFFVSQEFFTDGVRVSLDAQQTHHLRQVLRLKKGDGCLVANAAGQEAEARVEGFEEGKAIVILNKKPVSNPGVGNPTPGFAAGFSIRCFISLPQRGKMDDLVEKLQELGAAQIVPIWTQRTLVRMKGARAAKAVARWQRIAREAVKQSGARLTDIRPPVSFDEALKIFKKPGFIFHPSAPVLFSRHCEALKAPRQSQNRGPSSASGGLGMTVSLFFGPEGGFTDEEVAQAAAAGCEAVGLGEVLLKIDTAVLSAVAALKFGI